MGRVAGRPLGSFPKAIHKACPLCFFVSIYRGHERSVGHACFFGFLRERERETGATKEGKKNLLPLPLRVKWKKMTNNAIKTTSFAVFFSMKNE
jgi:hypothetical protein